MENCMLVKLKGASINADLPVFETVLEKEWIKTTEDNQYANTSIVSFPFKSIVFDVTFKANSAQMGEGYHCIVGTGSDFYTFEITKGENEGEGVLRYSLFSGSANVTNTIPCSLDEEHTLAFNPVAQTLTLDGNIIESAVTTSNGNRTNVYLFGGGSTPSSKASAISIGRFIQRQYTSSSGFAIREDLTPCIVNGTACMYNKEKGVAYTEANGGELLAYDDEE